MLQPGAGGLGALKGVRRFQVDAGDPPETGETLSRLIEVGIAEDDARRMMCGVLAAELAAIRSEGGGFDREGFVRALRRLPGSLRPE